jgi:hypothetical protein
MNMKKTIIYSILFLASVSFAQKDTFPIQCMKLSLQEVINHSDFILKVKRIDKNKFIVLKQIKTWGKRNWIGKQIVIINKKDDIIKANKRLSKIDKSMKVMEECYNPKDTIKNDTIIYFLKLRSSKNDKEELHFVTIAIDGYEGIKYEKDICKSCHEIENYMYCNENTH